jgi:hypothetical protein
MRGPAWAGCSHLVPFHRSARVPEFENPTLVQAEDEAQETALKVPPPAAGLGDGTMRHVTPFHRSARVLALGVKGLEAPTARHADGPVQATPIRAAPWAPGGFGVGWMCHTRPFHRSATVVPIPEGPKETPVVVQAEGDVAGHRADDDTFRPCGRRDGQDLPGLAVPALRERLRIGCAKAGTPQWPCRTIRWGTTRRRS